MRQALVTGAAGGIGQALCLAFRRAGYRVIATDLKQPESHYDVHLSGDLTALVREGFFGEIRHFQLEFGWWVFDGRDQPCQRQPLPRRDRGVDGGRSRERVGLGEQRDPDLGPVDGGDAPVGRPDPLGSTATFRTLAPAAGFAFFGLAAGIWHLGVRRYTSTGS